MQMWCEVEGRGKGDEEAEPVCELAIEIISVLEVLGPMLRVEQPIVLRRARPESRIVTHAMVAATTPTSILLA